MKILAKKAPTHPVRKFLYWTGWGAAQILRHPIEALGALLVVSAFAFCFFCVDASAVDQAINALLGRR